MILYKYVSYKAGYDILRTNTIGFCQPKLFNDPFELEAAYPTNDSKSPVDFIDMTDRRELKKTIWKENSAILSLTRASNNPLMWSHYCDKHKGFVIGFNVNQDLFISERVNLIPVQYGNVIYTATKPIHEFLTKPFKNIDIGNELSFRFDMLERLQRIYLYKPICWSYEEEVRIVKNISIKNKKGGFSSEISNVIKVSGNDLFVIKLPNNTIKEVHFGIRNPLMLNENRSEFNTLKEMVKLYSPDIKYFDCRLENSSWYIDCLQFPGTISEHIKNG